MTCAAHFLTPSRPASPDGEQDDVGRREEGEEGGRRARGRGRRGRVRGGEGAEPACGEGAGGVPAQMERLLRVSWDELYHLLLSYYPMSVS